MSDMEIEKAHVIILVYDVNNFDCIKRLRSYWIPRVLKINDKVKYATHNCNLIFHHINIRYQ